MSFFFFFMLNKKLVACILLMAVSNTSSLFSTYTNDLKKHSDINKKNHPNYLFAKRHWWECKDLGHLPGRDIFTEKVGYILICSKICFFDGSLCNVERIFTEQNVDRKDGNFCCQMQVKQKLRFCKGIQAWDLFKGQQLFMTALILNNYADMRGMLLIVSFTSDTNISSSSSSIKLFLFL